METFCKKISAEACSGKKIAGLLRKMMMMMMMTRKSRNCIWANSRVANRRQVGTARYESKKLLLVCFEGLARLSRRVWRRFVRGSREISLAPSL